MRHTYKYIQCTVFIPQDLYTSLKQKKAYQFPHCQCRASIQHLQKKDKKVHHFRHIHIRSKPISMERILISLLIIHAKAIRWKNLSIHPPCIYITVCSSSTILRFHIHIYLYIYRIMWKIVWRYTYIRILLRYSHGPSTSYIAHRPYFSYSSPTTTTAPWWPSDTTQHSISSKPLRLPLQHRNETLFFSLSFCFFLLSRSKCSSHKTISLLISLTFHIELKKNYFFCSPLLALIFLHNSPKPNR